MSLPVWVIRRFSRHWIRFDEQLSGSNLDKQLEEAVAQMFADFFRLCGTSGVREIIAGNQRAPQAHTCDFYGYINYLKDLDAAVQWALFMPDVVEKQQNGFKLDSFEYKNMPAMRFIGREGDDLNDIDNRINLFRILDKLKEFNSDWPYDVFFMHHYGLGVDVEPMHGFLGQVHETGHSCS